MKANKQKQADKLTAYNNAVKAAYFAILKVARQMLSTIPHEELRYSLIREDGALNEPGSIIYEFLNTLIYLLLECGLDNVYAIHYGVEKFQKPNDFTSLTAKFIRCIYRLTSKELNGLNIESCVVVDWIVTNCSEMYEHIEERNKYHCFKLIKHRVTSKQRKELLSVA